MINFKLEQTNFNHLKTQYEVIPITLSNFENSCNLIDNSIKNFKSEIEWEELFTLDEARQRLTEGMVMYVGIIDFDVFGHVWFKNHNDGRFLFNLFIRNQVEDKKYTGKEFLSDVIYRFEDNKTIYCEVDNWNEKSIKLFKRLGFQQL
jgi:RimJ/RimL family protein N-acetyltransferase